MIGNQIPKSIKRKDRLKASDPVAVKLLNTVAAGQPDPMALEAAVNPLKRDQRTKGRTQPPPTVPEAPKPPLIVQPAANAAAQHTMPQNQADKDSPIAFASQTSKFTQDLAKVVQISTANKEIGNQLYQGLLLSAQDPSSPYYLPYAKPTNRLAVDELGKLGIDASVTDQNFFARNAHLARYGRTDSNGLPLMPSAQSSGEEKAGYYYGMLLNAQADTQKAAQEIDALNRSIYYWANRADRNYSDDEVLEKIDWSKYPTLSRMQEDWKKGVPTMLNEAVDFNGDTALGMLWAARNRSSTGSHALDAVQYALQNGSQYKADPQKRAMLDPKSKTYNPYALGSTIDDAAQYFMYNGFDQKWLEDNKAILKSGDATAIGFYRQVQEAEQFTRQAEMQYTQLVDLINERMKYLKPGDKMDPEAILTDALAGFDALRAMDEGRLTGSLAKISRPLAYRWEDVAAQVNDAAYRWNKANGVIGNPANVDIAARMEKDAAIQADGTALQNDTAPKSYGAAPDSIWEGAITGGGIQAERKKPTFNDLAKQGWDRFWAGELDFSRENVGRMFHMLGEALGPGKAPEYPGKQAITKKDQKLGEFWLKLTPDETNIGIAANRQKQLQATVSALMDKDVLTADEQNALNSAWSELQGANALLFEKGQSAFDEAKPAGNQPYAAGVGAQDELESLQYQLQVVQNKIANYPGIGGVRVSIDANLQSLIEERHSLNTQIEEEMKRREKAKEAARWEAYNALQVPDGYYTKDPDMYDKWHIARAFEGNTYHDYIGEGLLGWTTKPFNAFSSWGDMEPTNRRLLTADEEARYQYIYDTLGEEYGKQYLNLLMDNGLRERTAQDAVIKAVEFTEFAPVAANISSTVLSVGAGFSGLVSTISGMFGAELTEDDMLFHAERLRQAVRAKTAEGMDETTAWFYGIGMSISDMLMTRGFGKASIFFQGGMSAGSKQMEVLEQGGTASEASFLGLVAGGLSIMIEGARLDRLFEMANTPAGKEGFKQFMKALGMNFFKEGVPEGLEEGLEYGGNLLADYMTRLDKSEIAQMKAKFLETTQGNEEEANRMLTRQIIGDALSNMGSGLIAAGFFSTVATIDAEIASAVGNTGGQSTFTQEELQGIREAEEAGDLTGASERYYAALERASASGGQESLASSGSAVTMTAAMVIDAAKGYTPEQLALPEVQASVSKYGALADKVLGISQEAVAFISAQVTAATKAESSGDIQTGTVGLLADLSAINETTLSQVMASVLGDAPSIKTAQTAARLMRLRQEMTGKASDANTLVQNALSGATAKAMQGVTVHTAGNLGHAVSLTMDTGHSLDFAGKRWGIAGINYMSNLVAAGHADAAAILPTLPTYSQSAVVAAKNMSGMALNEKGLNAQLQALAADLNNPFMMHNASARATRQAAEARVADLTEAGALPQIAEAQKHVDSARQTALNAQAAYAKVARNAQGARAALMAAQAAFGQNRADTAAMDAVMDAIGSVEDANQADAQAKLAYQSNQKALTAAQVKLDDLQQRTMASVQAQVKQEIAELRLKQEGAGLNRQTVLDKLLSGFVATARAEENERTHGEIQSEIEAMRKGPGVQAEPPIENVRNDGDPLAQNDGSGIIEEGKQGEVEARAAGSARNIPILKTSKDYGDYVIGIANRDDLSLDEMVQHIQEAYYQLEDKTDVNCPSDARFVKKILANGYIAYHWPKYYGFVPGTDNIKPITIDNSLPSLWYRVGPIWGSNFTTMTKNGKVPTMSDLSLPYIDNLSARHYGTFNANDYFDVINAIRDRDLDALNLIRYKLKLPKLGIEQMEYYKGKYDSFIEKVKEEIGDVDATYGLMGYIAPWEIDGNIVLKGGAEQISTPFPGTILMELGLLNLIK